jgi:iron complex outermembrane recepter protein
MDDINVGLIKDNNPQAIQAAHTLVSARVAILFGPDRRFQLALSGDNLTGEDLCVGIAPQPFDGALGIRDPVTGGTVMRCSANAPRTYSLSLKASF